MSESMHQSAIEIFYTLLQKKQLKASDEAFSRLHQEEELRNRLGELAEGFQCRIAWYPTAIYLIPDGENEYLGLTRSDFRKRIPGNDNAHQVNLRYFLILVLLLCFYDAQTSNHKVRPFLQLAEWMKEVGMRLEQAAKAEKEDGSGNTAFQRMLQEHEALLPEDNRSSRSKSNFYIKVLRFLEDEGLITWYEGEEQIRTLPMLDDKVDFLLASEELNDVFEALKKGDSHAGIE